MNIKVVGTLLSMAFLSAVLFLTALFHVEPLHAAEAMVFERVAIEDGSMRPLALTIDSNLDTNVNMPIKVDANSKVNGKANVDAKSNMNANVVSPDSTSYPVTVVSSTTDLDVYARTITENDDNLSQVVVTDDSVAVKYKEPARLLGFIPTEVLVTVEAEQDGTVSVKYPWYAFLAGKNSGKLKPGLQLHIGQILKNAQAQTATSTTATSTEITLSPQARAELIQAIHGVLKAHQASTTASIKASANAK